MRYTESGIKALGSTVKAEIKDGELRVDAFTVRIAQQYQKKPNGSTIYAERSTPQGREGFFLMEEVYEVDVAVPLRTPSDEPPDVSIETVGRFKNAHEVASLICQRIAYDLISNALDAEGQAMEHEERQKQAGEVF